MVKQKSKAVAQDGN